MEMLKAYHRTQVNPELLKHGEDGENVDLTQYLRGTVTDVLPKGRIIGLYYIPYTKELDAWSAIDYQVNPTSPEQLMATPQDRSFICAHTNIRVEDTRGHLITEPTDLKDYERKNWNASGYKELDFPIEQNEQITINYEALGDSFPPCGEFVYVIEVPRTC